MDQSLWQTPWIDWFRTFITHVNTNSIATCVIMPNNTDWDCFQDSDFVGDLEDSKSTYGRTSCIFGSHTFVPTSWMCKKHTSVSHSSTESEIIFLVNGLRLDGFLALDLWDLIAMQTGNVSGLFLPEILKTQNQNQLQVDCCAFSEVTRSCQKKLDVQEADFSFTQFYRSWNCFSRCKFTHGWNSSSWSLAFWSWKRFHSSTTPKIKYEETRRVTHTTSNEHTKNQSKVPTQPDTFDLSHVDCVPSNAMVSRFGAMLFIFEDNEAVIEQIIRGRSPTMRHVSRTHRVALDSLFDRINLDPRSKSNTSTPKTNLPTC